MNKLIALLGAAALVTVVACDDGKQTKTAEKPAAAAKTTKADAKKPAKADAPKKAAASKPATAAAPAKPADEAEVYAATILESDFDAEALRDINEANAEAELEALAKSIEGE